MLKQINQVKEFHDSFGVLVNNTPTIPSEDIRVLRDTLHQEEVKEVKEELLETNNIDKVAKELCDLLYVAYGTILVYGLQDKIEACFDEVHRSNMSKLEDGKVVRRGDGKVMKGKNYTPANIENILKN